MQIFIVISVLIVSGLLLYYFWIPWLAEHDVLFTKVTEGTAKAVMVNGRFKKMVMSFKDHHFNEKWDIIDDKGVAPPKQSSLAKNLGVHWIGIIASIYHYQFRWAEFKRDTTEEIGGHQVVNPRDEPTTIVMVKDFTYAFVAEDVKTKDNLPVRLKYSVTVYGINPYKMLFTTSDWLQRVQLATNRIARNVGGSKDYNELRQRDGANELAREIRQLMDKMPDQDESGAKLPGTAEQYGVGIRTADLQDVELTGGNASKFEEATVRHYTATQNADATVIEAKAKAEATLATGGADAKVIELKGRAEAKALFLRIAIIKKSPSIGSLLAQLDAMSAPGAGEKIIWANNPLVKNYDGLGELLDVLGVSSPKELAELIRNPKAA